ncbi:MAG: serine/threonine-protein kinase [Myxococcota bacterium]
MNAWVSGHERTTGGHDDVMDDIGDDIGEAATLLAEQGASGPAARAIDTEEGAGQAKEGPVDGVEGSVNGTGPARRAEESDGVSPTEESAREHSVCDDSISAGTGVGKQMAALIAPTPQDDRVFAVERARVFEAMFEVPAEPQRLGRYVVLGTLGKGGMGVVFKAFDPELDRQVALKVLHTELDEQHTLRLRREAQAMARLSHPNVVQVHEVGQAKGQTFVAMELVGGQTLKDWMRQQPRPTWRQCVEVFGQVGAGLAAAHEQGLIHRDFKPGNAIIDDNGRARVLDFGLARQAGDSLNADPDTDPNPDADPDADPVLRSVQQARTDDNQVAPLDVSLTKTGTVLGTPAYMPPEQMKGQPADARSDQFSFCIALYEAVYGQRPFEGGNMVGLMISMMNGQVKPAPKGSPVPATLRTMLLRGLAVDPEDRWPSMEALLSELQRLLAPRRWRWLGGGLALGLAGLGTTLATPQFLAMQERCSGAQAQLRGIWDDTRRQNVKDAVLGTELSYALSTWQRIEPQLDDYADAWADKHTEVCEATTVRHEQTEDAMTLRRGCLHERRTALRATVKVLAEAEVDTKTVENAVELVASLPDLMRCDDVERLEQQRQRMPPPEDPQVAEGVQEQREQLADIKAMHEAGRYAEALKQVQPVVEQAEALDYGPLRAEAKYRHGRLLKSDGQYAEAEQEYKQAHTLALEHEHDQVELDAVQSLTYVVGDSLARHNDGLTWGQTALALAKRSDDDLELASSLNNLGTVFDRLGEYEQAKQHYKRSLRIFQKALGPDHPKVAISLGNLGAVFGSLGEHKQAKRHHQRALRIEEKALGPDHPHVADSLNSLGGVFFRLGEHEQAKQHFERALRIREKALGPDHPYVAYSLNNLGSVFFSQGEYEQAKLHHQRSLQMRKKALGPDHPHVATSLNSLGNVFNSQGEYEQAKQHYQRALQIWEKALDPDHPHVATSLNNLGIVFKRLGEYEQAKLHLQRALRIREKALGPDHPRVATSLDNLGNVFKRLGEYEHTKQHYQRALRIFEKALGPDHPDVAMSLNNLGTVFKRLGEYEQAKQHFERALRIQEKVLGSDHPDVAYLLVGLAEVALAQHDPTVAREHAERAVSIREKGSVAPELLADTRFALARALWSDKTQRVRARALAEQAREALVAAEGPGETDHDLAYVTAWQATHRVK